jgi:hypothetical protein
LSNEEVGLSRTFSVVVPEAGHIVFRGDAKSVEPSGEGPTSTQLGSGPPSLMHD